MRRVRTWILIANGSSARLIRQLHTDAESGQRLEDISYEQEEKPLRQMMSDRPGRSFSSVGQHRSSMEYRSDPVRNRHRQFARHLVQALAKYRISDSFDRLVLVAEPRMLGLIRQEMDNELRELVTDEIDKDLVKLPRRALVDALSSYG